MTNAERSASKPPAALGFDHIRRRWDARLDEWVADLLPGDYYVTSHREWLLTRLGSCIAVCMSDPVVGVGGMNHFMLPHASESTLTPVSESARYGAYAMEQLINSMLKLGARRDRLELKIFGGARMLSSLGDVGRRNISFIRQFAQLEGLRVTAQDVGGDQGRRVMYSPKSGRAFVRKLEAIERKDVAANETAYHRQIDREPVGGDVDLF
jgi:chemotaxis protein CheD